MREHFLFLFSKNICLLVLASRDNPGFILNKKYDFISKLYFEILFNKINTRITPELSNSFSHSIDWTQIADSPLFFRLHKNSSILVLMKL